MIRVFRRFYIIALLASVVFPTASYASQWVDNLTIKRLQLFYDSGFHWLKIYVNEPVNIGCSRADSEGVFAYPQTALNDSIKTKMSFLMQAKATELPISIYTNLTCYADHGAIITGISLNE